MRAHARAVMRTTVCQGHNYLPQRSGQGSPTPKPVVRAALSPANGPETGDQAVHCPLPACRSDAAALPQPPQPPALFTHVVTALPCRQPLCRRTPKERRRALAMVLAYGPIAP